MKTKNVLPITTARRKIFLIAEEAQKGEVYTLTERGIPKVVILSAERFEILEKDRYGGSLIFDGGGETYSRRSQTGSRISQPLIIRDESRVVYLSANDQNSKYQEENLIKAQLYVELIEKYGYPVNWVEFGRYVRVGTKSSKHYIEADAIVNDERGNARMIFEAGSFLDFEKNSDQIVSDLFDLAGAVSFLERPDWLIYFSRSSKSGKEKEKIVVIDGKKFVSFASWKKAGRPAGKTIPQCGEK